MLDMVCASTGYTTRRDTILKWQTTTTRHDAPSREAVDQSAWIRCRSVRLFGANRRFGPRDRRLCNLDSIALEFVGLVGIRNRNDIDGHSAPLSD